MMSSIYNRLSQLIPGCLFLSYKTIEPIILGLGVCSLEQKILLWGSIISFASLCLISSYIADGAVQYVPSVSSLGRVIRPDIFHASISTLAFLIIVLFSPPTFSCLFEIAPNDVTVQALPILTGSILLSVYGMMFDLPKPEEGQ